MEIKGFTYGYDGERGNFRSEEGKRSQELLFQTNIKNHIETIKRIGNCIGCEISDAFFEINVPEQSTNDCGCCVCYFAQKYSMNMLRSVQQTNELFNGNNIKIEMDNERKRMINSINENHYFYG